MQVPAQFGVDAAATDENAVHCRDRQRKRRVEQRGARAGPFGLGHEGEPGARGRGRVQMFRAGERGGDTVEATGYGDIHADNRDASVNSWLLSKRTRDVDRHVGGRGENIVGDELGVLAGQANGAGKASGRVEPHFAGGAYRAAVGRCPCETIDPNRVPVRSQGSGDPSELESRLIVPEFAAAQANRSLRLRFCDRPAQLKSDRERAGGVTTGHGKHGIGEPRVEGAVDLHVQRPVGREGSRAGHAHGVARPGIDRDIERCSPSREPAGASDVKRRQPGVAHLRNDHALQTHTPFTRRSVWSSADVGFTVCDAGQAEARRKQIKRRQRHARRIRLEGQGRSSMAG